MAASNEQTNARKDWMGLLATSSAGRVTALLEGAMELPEFTWLRVPEIGTVMVQGRAGATGAPFNVGEMTVTRGSLQLWDGTVGHAYLQGRRKVCVQAAAIVDALMQGAAAAKIRAEVLEPLEAERDQARQSRSEKAAATKVDFFALMRGED